MNTRTVAWKFLPILLSLLLLLNVPLAQAADTGFLPPTANAADSGGDGNGFETNPNNAHADGGGAAGSTNGVGDRHRYFNFNIPAIPSSQAITGIVVRLDGRVVDSTSGVSDYDVELSWDGGANWTNNNTTTELSQVEQTFNVGATNDTWGRTWSSSELSNANFRVRITSSCTGGQNPTPCSGRDFELDYVAVQITYLPETTPPTSSATSPTSANAPFTVTANNAADAGSGVANVRLYFRGPTGNWTLLPGSQINAPGPYQWNFTPGLSDGTYFFQSVACDNNNNCETVPSGGTGNGDDSTLYDTTAPTSQANPPAGPITAAPIAVPWTANGNVSGIATNGIRLRFNFNGGGFTDSSTASGTSGTFNFTPPSGDGTYCFYTIATDNAGNIEAAPAPNDGCTIYRTRSTLSGLVWLDADGNGFQNGETGLDGVTVTLSQGSTTIGTDTTAGGGLYSFSDLAGGVYIVTVTGGLPAGYTATSEPASPRQVTLSAGQDFDTANFGYGPFAVVGDLIYLDTNRNGAFNNGEPGLPSITAWLYTDGNGNGKIDGADSILRTASTNAAGQYALQGVPAGNYTVLADANDPQLPASVQATSSNPVAVANVVTGNTYPNADIGFNTPPPVVKQLYLRSTSVLSRTQPTGGTHSTRQIVNNGSFTWQQTPVLAGPVAVTDGQPVLAQIRIDAFPSTGLICGGQNPDVLATLSIAGGATLDTDTINNMTPGLNTRTFTFNLAPGTVIPTNARLELRLNVSGADCGAGSGYIIVNFDSAGELSHLEIPTTSYIKIDQAGTFDVAYPGGAATPIFIQGDTVYVRATASDPFGSFDISGMTLSVPGVVMNTAMTSVTSNALTRTFERALPGLLGGTYTYVVTATEGLEGQVTAVATGTFNIILSNLGNSTKTVDKATAAPGDVLNYTIVLSNTGGLNATVRMTDTLPANVTRLSGPTGPAGATYNAGLNAVLFNGPVPANGQVVINYQVTANMPLDNGAIIANNVTIDDGFSRFDTSPPATTIIQAAPNLSQSAKSVNLATAAPGDTVEYTIVLSNTGNMNAVISAGNPVLDDIPANTTFNGGLFASAGQISYNVGFNRVEWNGTVPAGSSVTLRYRALLAAVLNNGTVITNTAIINEGTGFPTPQTYQRVATTTLTSAPNLASQSSKLVDRAVAAPGDTLVYTILLRNTGNMHAPGVVMTDTLPAQVTWSGDAFMSATSGTVQFVPATRTVIWQGNLNVGATVQILFRVSANSPLPNNTLITNVARVSDGAGNFAPFDLQALTTIQASPNLNTSTKTVNAATANPGDTLTYTLRLVNTGNAVANASLVDNLPAQLQNPVIISTSSGQAQVVGGNQVTWTGQVTPTQPVTITFRATLLSVLNNGTQVANTAQINDGVNLPFFINPPAMTTITSEPNLITSRKTVDQATASPNDILIYTITLTNTGNMVASTLVRDVLPPNVTFNGGLSASPGAPLPTYSAISNRIDWQGNVTPGTPVTISYQVRINTPLDNGTVILNDAEINDGVHAPFDTTPPAQTTITSAPNLTTSSKSVDLTTASPGDLLHYTIRLANTGNMIASGATISDTLPTQVTLASGPFITGGGSGGFNLAQRRVFWNGSVAPGNDVIVEYFVTINSPLPNGTQIVNDAQIQGSFGTITTNPVTTTVQSDHQLNLTKNAPSAVGAGQVMTYTVQYNVTGNEPAPNVVITDAVPANTAFASCSGGVSCSQAVGVVTWNLGNLNPGNSGAVTLRVTVNTPLPDGTVINNTARIFDTDGGAAQSSASATVTSGHGFSLTKRDTGFDPVQAGGPITYSIDWSVAGTSVANGVIITDVVPVNTTYQSCGGATCVQGGGVVTWTLNTQNPGAFGTVTLTVNVTSPLPNNTILTNQARISDSNGGLATTATEQTTVHSSHSLNVTKNAPANVAAGGQLVYTIDWSVAGNEPAQNVVVEDNTPINTTFASASGAATINNPGVGNTGLVRWNLGNQPPGASGTVTLVVNVASPLPNGTNINNTASVRDSNNGTTAQDSVATTVTSGHGFTLTKTDAPDPVSPNNIINYTIHWVVTGNGAAQNVIITDTIPANTTFFSCSGCSQQGSIVTWNLGNPNPGASGDVTLQVRVNPLTPNGTVIPNTARISDSNGGTPTTATTTTTVQSGHSLTIDKIAPAAVGAGQQIVYTINYGVLGDEQAPAVVITDAIPANTSFLNCTGTCTVNNGIATWNLGNLPPGTLGQVQLAVRVNNGAPNGTDILNTAYISDNSGANATDSTTTRVGSDLNILLTDERATVQPGELISYTINYSGTEPLSFGTVGIDLPANTTFVSASSSYLQSGNNIFWFLTAQPAGFSGQRFLVVQLLPVLDNGTIISTTARIAGDTQNNQDDESAVVVSRPNLTTSNKTVSNPGATPGDLVTYRIALTNTGNMHAYQTTITDAIPAEMVYGGNLVASSGIPTFIAGQVRWQGEVRVGIPVVITFEARVSDTVGTGTVVENIADINDGVNPIFQRIAVIAVGSAASARTSIFLPMIMSQTEGSPAPTEPGIELTIRNCGNVNAVGAFWVDLYFNPNEQSIFWPINHGEGYDWFGQGAGYTVSTLGPGQSLSLHLSDAVVKNLPNPLPDSARLYAQLDLFDKTVPGIGVVDEGPGGEANNVAGSNGSVCSATSGKPDLIVESIRLVGVSSGSASLSVQPAQEGVEPAPARVQPPQP